MDQLFHKAADARGSIEYFGFHGTDGQRLVPYRWHGNLPV
jgi:hypothetical protein